MIQNDRGAQDEACERWHLVNSFEGNLFQHLLPEAELSAQSKELLCDDTIYYRVTRTAKSATNQKFRTTLFELYNNPRSQESAT